MKTGNIVSAPLYVVYGSLTSKNEMSIRSYSLKRAKNRNGSWFYPSDLGTKEVLEKKLELIDKEVTNSGKINYRIFFTKKSLLSAMVNQMNNKLLKMSKGVAKMPIAVKSPAPVIAIAKPVIKKVVPDIIVEKPKSIKIVRSDIKMPAESKELMGRDLDDYVAIKNILNGNTNEFSVIYKRYYDIILFRYCRSFNFTQNELAKDLLMEMFTKVYEKLDQYIPKFTFNAWITKISKNYLIDYCRRNKNIHMVSIDKAFGEDDGDQEMTMAAILPDDGSNCPEKLLVNAERKEALIKAMSFLDDQVRRILIQRFFYKASYAEIMKQENVPVSHVKISIFRAKQKLKEVLTEHPQLMAACAL